MKLEKIIICVLLLKEPSMSSTAVLTKFREVCKFYLVRGVTLDPTKRTIRKNCPAVLIWMCAFVKVVFRSFDESFRAVLFQFVVYVSLCRSRYCLNVSQMLASPFKLTFFSLFWDEGAKTETIFDKTTMGDFLLDDT